MRRLAVWRWIDAFVIGFSLTVVGVLFTAVSVSAHAYLAESMPRNGEQVTSSPGEVVGIFTEELSTEVSTMEVFNENGQQVDNGDGGVDLFDPDHKTLIVSLPANLPSGKYTVEWVSLSLEDGDTTDGAFVFGINTDVEAAVAIEDSESYVESGGKVGWWVGGGIVALILFLLVAMLLLTRQPSVEFE